MEIVSEYSKVLLSAAGKQAIDLNSTYRLANYTYLTKYEENVLLYNNVSKRLFRLNEQEARALEDLEKNDLEFLKPLIEDWSLVKPDFDDMAFVDQVRWFYDNFNRKYEKPSFVIFTTTRCNARCYYCFENGQHRVDMTEQTAEDVANYIIKNAPNKEVNIKWFGGEPLYNEKVIDIICERLTEARVKYDTDATTNGYLFDEQMIEKAKKKWRLSSVVITLDGTKDVYNKIKNYIYDDENAFDRVINNIGMLLKSKIKVSIRLNIGIDNFEDLKELVRFIKKHFGDNNNLNIIPIALYDLNGTRSSDEHFLFNSMVKEIEDMLHDSKYRRITTKIFSDMGRHCMAELDSCKVISPRGELGTCEHYSEGEMMYGSIYSNEEKLDVKNYFKQRDILEQCKSCVLYGNCGGVGRCPTLTGRCTDFEREIKFRMLEKTIAATYDKYIENGRKTITE